MVFIFATAMPECKTKSSKDNKSQEKGGKKPRDKKKIMRDGCLIFGIILLIIGSVIMFTIMDDEQWLENSFTRQRILLVAVFMFLLCTGLCLYVMRTDRKQENFELELLVIERPPSYDSVVFSEPPPSYTAVVKSIHIIQQETTG